MKPFNFILAVLFGLVFNNISCAQSANNDFGRLFTTPDERSRLQILRFSEPDLALQEIEIIVEEIEEAIAEIKPRDLDEIILNGIVYRKGNKSTVWLNGNNSYEGELVSEYFQINTEGLNREEISVTVPEIDLKLELKVGQTYAPNTETLFDIVKNRVEITILKD